MRGNRADLRLIALAILFLLPAFSLADNICKIWGNYEKLVYVIEYIIKDNLGIEERDLERIIKLKFIEKG